MKKLKLAVIILLMLSLTGCIKEYKATEEQSDAIAEYAAGAILENDRQYDQELIAPDAKGEEDAQTPTITNTPSPAEPTGTATTDNSGSDDASTANTYSLTEVINAPDFQINYKSYELMDVYSEDEYFEINPRENCKLLVVSFTIKNVSAENQTLNLLQDDGIKYELYVNSESDYTTPLLTFLENDLKYIKMPFAAGKSKKGLLIFEVPSNIQTTNMKLIVTNNDKSSTVELK